MFYKNKVHQMIFTSYVKKCKYKLPERTLAAIYLLSSDKNAWKRMKKNINKKEIIFKDILISKASEREYAAIKIAYDIYADDISHLTIFDLGDKYLIDDKMFEIIFTAIKIARDGYEEIGVQNINNTRSDNNDC